jgi:hypothetical protein
MLVYLLHICLKSASVSLMLGMQERLSLKALSATSLPILQAMLILNPKCRANVLHSVFANLLLKFKLKKRRMMIEITSSFVLLCQY